MEVFIRWFVQLILFLQIKVFKCWHNDVLAGKIRSYNVASVLFLSAITLIILMYVQIRLSVTFFEIIASGTLACLLLFYGVTIMTDGFGRAQEEARVWMGWSLFWVCLTGFIGLLMEFMYHPDANKYLEIRLGSMVPFMFPVVYDLVKEKLNRGGS